MNGRTFHLEPYASYIHSIIPSRRLKIYFFQKLEKEKKQTIKKNTNSNHNLNSIKIYDNIIIKFVCCRWIYCICHYWQHLSFPSDIWVPPSGSYWSAQMKSSFLRQCSWIVMLPVFKTYCIFWWKARNCFSERIYINIYINLFIYLLYYYCKAKKHSGLRKQRNRTATATSPKIKPQITTSFAQESLHVYTGIKFESVQMLQNK